jgi:hypothetical protein
VRNGRPVDDGIERDAGNLQSADGLLAAGTYALHFDFERLDAEG